MKKFYALAAALAMLAGALLTGCSPTAARHTAAVEQAIISYDKYYFEVEDLAGQLKEQVVDVAGGPTETATYTVTVQFPDLSSIDAGDVDYAVPDYDLHSPDAAAFDKQLYQAFYTAALDYANAGNAAQYVDVPILFGVRETRDGSWVGALSQDSEALLDEKADEMIRSLYESATPERETLARLQVAEAKNDLLQTAFGASSYVGAVQVDAIDVSGPAQCQMTISYPDPAEVYMALADAEITSYDEPVFDSVSVSLDAAGFSFEARSFATKTATLTVDGNGDYDFTGATLSGYEDIANEIEQARQSAREYAQQEITAQWLVSPQDQPQTGVLSGESTGNRVSMDTSADAGDYCVRFYEVEGDDYTADGIFTLSAYIRGGESCTVYLPSGNYKVIYGTGTSWYGEEHMFGPQGSYNRMDGIVESQNGYYTELTLYLVEGGNTGVTPVPYPS